MSLLERYSREELADLLEDATEEEAAAIEEALEAELYELDPVLWVRSRTGEFLWSKQREIMEAVALYRKVAVKACHGPGKSWTAARVVAHWEDVHPPGSAFAVTTAPTWQQVKTILWREIRQAHRKGNLPGRVTLNAEWIMGDEPVATGRKPADHDETGFQGIHARYLLAVLDEACGVPKQLWTAVDTLVTNEDGRILAIGNPDDPTSEFATICEGAPEDGSSGFSREGWYVITISVFDTPNFTGEEVPDDLRPFLPSQVWLEERRRKWGEGSPLWLSKVLGQFPPDAAAGVIPWSWLRRVQGPEQTARVGALRVPVELGVDVAGSELGDETVVYERRGPALGRRWAVQSADPEVVIRKVEEAVVEARPTRVKIDSIGVGWGVMGALRRSFPDLEIVGVNVSESAPGEDAQRFYNLRAWLWWEVGRRLVQDRAVDLSPIEREDPEEDRLARLELEETLNELAAPRYTEVNGRIKVESKEEIRKRISRSTDNADAVLLAFYEGPGTELEEESYELEDVLDEDGFR